MSHVTVKINGYAYTLGCEDGQEQHLSAMAEQVEGRIASIRALGSNTGEARLLVLAALLMADELHDTRIELETLRAAGDPVPEAVARPARRDAEAKRLSRLALRAEQVAAKVEDATAE